MPFYETNALDLLREPFQIVQPNRHSPVMKHKRDILELKCLDECVDISNMIFEAVLDVGLPRSSHADQIRGDAPRLGNEVWNDVSPQERGRRVAVEEYNRHSGTTLQEVHRLAEYRRVVRLRAIRLLVHQFDSGSAKDATANQI